MALNTVYITAFNRSATNGITAPRNFKTAIAICINNPSISEYLVIYLCFYYTLA